MAVHIALAPANPSNASAPTSVSLFDQGLVQIIQASITGLTPRTPYVLALAGKAEGSSPLQLLSGFMTNPAVSAIVNATGPIRQIVAIGAAVQIQQSK